MADKKDPDKCFVRRRNGKAYLFDQQIKLWQKYRKKKGACAPKPKKKKSEEEKLLSLFGDIK